MRIYMQRPPIDEKPARYYQLVLQEDLLEGWSLLVESGQQGSQGRIRHEHFASLDQAVVKLESLRNAQLNRGYRTMYVEGQHLSSG